MRFRLAAGPMALSLFLLVASSPASPPVPDRPDSSPTDESTAFSDTSDLGPGAVDLRVSGTLESSTRIVLTMEFGRPFKKGMKIFGEPSHTLIVAGMTPEFAASVEGIGLRMEASAHGVPTITEGFPNARPRIVLTRPEGDLWLTVYAITGNGDFRVATIAPGQHDFIFTAGHQDGAMRSRLQITK